MKDQQLINFGGNYDTYMQTRRELEEEQTKRYMFEQEQIAHMKEYIARFGHGSAKLARQAQSKEKTLQKMIDAGLTKPVSTMCYPWHSYECEKGIHYNSFSLCSGTKRHHVGIQVHRPSPDTATCANVPRRCLPLQQRVAVLVRECELQR
jgi:hypothetical protein